MPDPCDRWPDEPPEPWEWRALGRLIHVEVNRFHHSLHLWVGPAGLHLFWPDVWKSRPDWSSTWREPVS